MIIECKKCGIKYNNATSPFCGMCAIKPTKHRRAFSVEIKEAFRKAKDKKGQQKNPSFIFGSRIVTEDELNR